MEPPKVKFRLKQVRDRIDGRSEYVQTHSFNLVHKSDAAMNFLKELLAGRTDDDEVFTRFEVESEDGNIKIIGSYTYEPK